MLVPAKNGSVFMMTAWRGQTKIGRKAIFLIPDDPIGYMRANSEGSVQNALEIMSFLIDFTPLDTGKDVLDFLAGKDTITGEEINRWVLLGCIVAPGFLDTALKAGAKNADEVAEKVVKLTIKHNQDITTFYRAVGPDEFYAVMSLPKAEFSIIPQAYAGKQFGLNLDETLKFADKFPDIAAILEVKISTDKLNQIADFTQVDRFIFKSGTVTISADKLSLFNKYILDVKHKI